MKFFKFSIRVLQANRTQALLIPWFLFFLFIPNQSQAILNGFLPKKAAFPFLNRIVTIGVGLNQTCTGFLLTPRAVLTASHCMPFFVGLKMGAPTKFAVYNDVGFAMAKSKDVVLNRYVWDRTHFPPSINLSEEGELGDLVILFLNESFFPQEVFSQKIKLGFDFSPDFLYPTFAFGTGQYSDDRKSLDGVLRTYKFKQQPAYGPPLFADRIYFDDLEEGALCHGDSGGPLLFKAPDTKAWHLAGVFSHMSLSPFTRFFGGEDCSDASRNAYTSVYYHTVWIQKTVRDLYKKHGEKLPKGILVGSPPEI